MNRREAEELASEIELEAPNCKVVDITGPENFMTLDVQCANRSGTATFSIHSRNDWDNWLRNNKRNF